jgi:CMP/dCMP kinase
VSGTVGPRPYSGVVALDGPSGTGKSTVARRLATRLDCRYLDTGAMYRAATLAVLDAGADPSDSAAVVEIVERAAITISTDPASPTIWLGEREVDREIRDQVVTAAVSAVSAVSAVRSQLVAAQRVLIGTGGIVVEGRDIATVVWPAARPKIYLTASEQVRAQRRAADLGTHQVAEVQEALARRDRLDSTRGTSPLVQAGDAIVVDTTYLSIDEVIEQLVDMVMAVRADS